MLGFTHHARFLFLINWLAGRLLLYGNEVSLVNRGSQMEKYEKF